MNDREDDELDSDEEEFPVYEVDDDTRALLEAALNCLVNLSQAQVSEESQQAILGIADSLALRFDISRLEVEEEIHSTDEGEEVIYRPKNSIFKSRLLDDDEDDA